MSTSYPYYPYVEISHEISPGPPGAVIYRFRDPRDGCLRSEADPSQNIYLLLKRLKSLKTATKDTPLSPGDCPLAGDIRGTASASLASTLSESLARRLRLRAPAAR
jgi:hypothetical protein